MHVATIIPMPSRPETPTIFWMFLAVDELAADSGGDEGYV